MTKTKNNKTLGFLLCFFLLSSCNADSSPAPADTTKSTGIPVFRVDNLSNNQRITAETPTLFRIVSAKEISFIEVTVNGKKIGRAEFRPQDAVFRFSHSFAELGDADLVFSGFVREGEEVPLATAIYRIRVVSRSTPAPSRLFNSYVLKAVDYLTKNWGLLGYNIDAQLTHPLEYYKFGVLKPTKNGLTMCVSGVLEVIITAFDIYSKETGDHSIYDFLPFQSWNTLAPANIKAHIWVDPKLNSYGTADAISKFGIGEKLKFKDLQPGSFININRTTGTGHAVVFLNFIDIKGQEVPEYNSTVAGFRYFGAQGKIKKGEGGLSYRYAFFSKNGCPEVPFQRDCNVLFSDDSKVLNVGQMLDPADWKHKRRMEDDDPALDPLTPEEAELIHPPTAFNGITTDD